MLYSIYDFLLIPWLITAIIAFILLFTVTAPYGRFSNSSWGYLVNYRFGWFLQEIISPLSFSFFFFNGSAEKTIVSWVLFFIWVLHYINRSIIFPMRIPDGSKIPIPIIASAIFVTWNSSKNMRLDFDLMPFTSFEIIKSLEFFSFLSWCN